MAHREAKTLPPLLLSLALPGSERERERQSESGEAGRRVATDGFTSGGCTEELWDAVTHRKSSGEGGRGVGKSQSRKKETE